MNPDPVIRSPGTAPNPKSTSLLMRYYCSEPRRPRAARRVGLARLWASASKSATRLWRAAHKYHSPPYGSAAL